MQPRVSVAFPVLNGMPYLTYAVNSIRSQTLQEVEIVILDNGSTDGSLEFALQTARVDDRIRVTSIDHPLGLVVSANTVVGLCSSPIVARMDADDISHPERLSRQLEAFDIDPDVVLVGVMSDGIDARGRRIRRRDRSRLLHQAGFAPFPGGSIMFRRDAFHDIGGYMAGTEGREDLDLCLRISSKGKLLVLTDTLYSYRHHLDNSTTLELDRYGARARLPIAAQRIWAGDRAPLLSWPPDLRSMTLKTLVYETWGAVSPRTLRAAMAAIVCVRDWLAGWRLRRAGVKDSLEWSTR